jgi:aspartyl protease family protein
MIKSRISSIVLVTFVSLNINFYNLNFKSATAQNCYMEGDNGEAIDLSELCGIDNGSPNSTTPSTTTDPPSSIKPNPTDSRSRFEIPIKRRDGGTPVVDVIFNGKQTYEMLFDTGASGTVLTVKMAKELRLKTEGTVMVSTPSHNSTPFFTTTVNSIKVGKGILKDVKVVISPTLPIGLLGQDFFDAYDLTIKEDVIEFKRR